MQPPNEEVYKIIDALIKLIQIFVLPFCIYVISALNKINEKLITLTTILLGVDGQEGLVRRVKALEERSK